MKKLLLLCACLLVLAAPLRAAVALPPAILVVRVYEGAGKVTLIITRGEGQSEKVEFDRGNSDENLIQSSEGYYRVFQQLYQQGYTLQSTFSTPRDPYTNYTTLLFTKPGN